MSSKPEVVMNHPHSLEFYWIPAAESQLGYGFAAATTGIRMAYAPVKRRIFATQAWLNFKQESFSMHPVDTDFGPRWNKVRDNLLSGALVCFRVDANEKPIKTPAVEEIPCRNCGRKNSSGDTKCWWCTCPAPTLAAVYGNNRNPITTANRRRSP